MDALILAGGPAPPELATNLNCTERALIDIGGRPIIAFILDALRRAAGIERVAVVGNEPTLRAVAELMPEAHTAQAGSTMVVNLVTGMKALDTPQVLVCTCDIPLVTGATFDALLERATARHLEAAYPIVRRTTCQAQFPAGRRTYATLRDGSFTGGNAMILPGRSLEHMTALAHSFYGARKNPVAVAKVLGVGFMVKFAAKRLGVPEVEAKMSQLLGCRAGAIEMDDATIAFDVDKLDDYHVARQALEQRATPSK